jgi:hypothetical protein
MTNRIALFLGLALAAPDRCRPRAGAGVLLSSRGVPRTARLDGLLALKSG